MFDLPCVKRQEIALVNKDGTTGLLARCSHQACSRYNTDVTAADCNACPLRVFTVALRPEGFYERQIVKREYAEPRIVDGNLVYEPNGLKPPSVPNGYRRKGEDGADAWVFIPAWPSCVDREMANTVQRCGCIKIDAMCASKESERHGQPVTLAVCEACPVRRALLEKVVVDQGTV